MSRFFGQRINEFVLSIDIMDEKTFKALMALVQEYVNKHLDVTYFSVLVEGTVDNELGLCTVWTTRDDQAHYSLSKDGNYRTHSTYTFAERTGIWVVTESKGPLHEAEDLKDLWSNVEKLPLYQARKEEDVRTSVMHPLKKDNLAIGVIEFAAMRYIEPTPASKQEVQTLAALVSRAYQMYETRKAQSENTDLAMKLLSESLKAQNWTRLALPQVFVAYAGPRGEEIDEQNRQQHQQVIDTVRAVADEFTGRLSVEFWEDKTEPGDINQQIIETINSSDFGLCYFSEPTPEGSFRDNSNVLFEAGMMQALKYSPNAPLREWIPVREKKTEKVPFDLAGERTVTIDRPDGAFDPDALAGQIRTHFQGFVEKIQGNN